MRGNPKLVIAKHLYCFAAFFILISFFAGCTAGSCLSYGHSCWGAHGKRSMDTRPLESFGSEERKIPTSYDGRWILSRLMNQQLIQTPLAVKLRARLFEERSPPLMLKDRLGISPNAVGIKHSNVINKISGDVDIKDIPKIESRMTEPSDVLLFPQRKDFIYDDDDQAIKMGLYKILLKNIDERAN